MSSQSFADLGVSPPVVAALTERGIESPFAIQQLVIADVLAGHDVLAKSPTGSGKTLAFGLPMVDIVEATDQHPSALVLAPTRELASQIVDELYSVAHARALRIKAVYGGVGMEKQGREAARAHIIVATPGRLEEHLQRGTFSLKNVRLLVLDEADRMLDMGFRPAVDRIVAKCPTDRQTVTITTLGTAYRKFPLRYTAAADTDDATLEITGTGTGSLHIGAVSLMPADNIEGYRPEVVAALKQMRFGVLRFPGGNFVSSYEWRYGVGDIDKLYRELLADLPRV